MAGIYLHIPFCKQACTYCNFHFSTSLKLKEQVLAAVMRELEIRRDYLAGQPVETIYFGGGTPSLLSADEINRITDHIYRLYTVRELKEFTLEANPDDLSKAYISSLRDTQIDRFSIGVQSFRDEDLAYMHRAHNAQEADYAIKAAQDAGFTNLTIDLIYGTPGLTDGAWKANLEKTASLGVQHFSSYALTVEEGTALQHAIARKKTAPVEPEQAAAQFEILMHEAQTMGFDHYEISNFALPGHYAVHNTNYWMGVHYLGIGPSAHSFNGSSRSWNVANNALYSTNILQHNQLVAEEEILTREQQVNEYIMTSLRTMWGTDLALVQQRFGSDYRQLLEKNSMVFQQKGQMERKDDKLVLTPTGKLFADGIAGDLFIFTEDVM
jgi:oxygen-independent coproporphyrinogen-3 oxidase